MTPEEQQLREQLAREELDRTQRLNAQLAFENQEFRTALRELRAILQQMQELNNAASAALKGKANA